MRQLTAYASYLDNLGAPLVGRARFCNMDKSPAVVYGLDNGQTPRYVPIGSTVYTNSSGQLVPQVFLADHDYLIFFDKYIGGGTMSEDDDPESWPEQGSAVDKYNTVGIELDGSAVRSFGTVDALRSVLPVESADGDNEIVELLGYNEPGDKPSIQYQWDPNSSEPDNGGSVLGTGAVGRWKLVECPEFLDVRHFGAFPDQTSGGNADQRNRVQLAGAYAHFNSCGIHFYGDALAVYYDISGLELFKTTSDDIAKVYAVAGTESTIREVVNINCGADQFTTLANQGKITLIGDLLRASFAPNYNVLFSPTRKMVVDSDVQTTHLDVWNAIVEVTVDTTSHWVLHNTPIESVHHLGNNITINGATRLTRDMFQYGSGMDFSTITIPYDVTTIDIDDWSTDTAAWCKLVKQQSRRDFDMKDYTLDSDCDLSFNDGSTLTLMNATLSGFSSAMNLTLKSCRGSLNYPQARTLQLDGCSEGLIISSINQNASINSRYSRIQLNAVIMTVDNLTMLGGHISSSSTVLSVKDKFEAMDTKVYCKIEAGELLLTDCVVLYDVAGKTVTVRSCIFSDVNVDAYSPYNDSDRNVITVEATGNNFLGSSKLRLRTTYSSESITFYDLSFNVCGNFSDHDFVDDSAFNGVTHSVQITDFKYKGNYGGCPVDSKLYVTNIDYLGSASGATPSSQADNTLVSYETYLYLKMNMSLLLDSIGIFRMKYMNLTPNVIVYPICKCQSGDGVQSSIFGDCISMAASHNALHSNSIQYTANYSIDVARDRGLLLSRLARIEWKFETDGVLVGT